MYRWKTAVGPTVRNTKVLVTDPDGHELLKAVLPPVPGHPRALLTLLEGLALWAGHPLTAVISAGPALPRHVDEALFGGALVPVDSALVRFDVAPRVPRRRTLRGLGDFRQLRLVQRRWA
jgi:hypothetical protein